MVWIDAAIRAFGVIQHLVEAWPVISKDAVAVKHVVGTIVDIWGKPTVSEEDVMKIHTVIEERTNHILGLHPEPEGFL